ncbi:MAG TPA: tetratricopeptide repeat protein [Rhodocyclaceae bacterium]|jgi:predicted O-linked N-acetylglucosamine transferase (SPINDLY family)
MLSQYISAAHAANVRNEFQAAITWCEAAIALVPNLPEAWYNLGLAYKGLGQKDKAIDALSYAGNLTKDSVDAQNSVGFQLLELGDVLGAELHLKQALKLNPRYALAHSNWGLLLEKQNNFQGAEKAFRKALELQPELLPVYINLGGILNAQGKFQSAIPACRKAVEFLPDSSKAWNNLGSALSGNKQYQAAVECYEKCLRISPETPFVLGHLASDLLSICSWEKYGAVHDALINGVNSDDKVATPFQALVITENPALQRRAAEIYVTEYFSVLREKRLASQDRKNGKIRVAYYSSDFFNHPVSLLLAGILKAHDKDKFEIIGVDLGGARKNDDVHHEIKKHCDVFIEAGDMCNDEILHISREHCIDIAVDLNGHTGESRTGVFAAGVAPIQVNYLGYTGTMGADFMDYIVADKVTIPEPQQHFYQEKVITLPECYFPPNQYDPIANRSFRREECGLPAQGFVFGCFNNSYKLNPTIFESWGRILKQVDGSVLWLSGMQELVRDNLREEAIKYGINPGRLIFADRVPSRSEHLSRHRLMDLFLDTLPYNAHTTASDALTVGVPVLTCMGDAFASRVAASLIQSVGLEELVTDNLPAYEAMAIALAKDPEKLIQLKNRLAQNLATSSLVNVARYARNLESAYETMYERFQSGLAPESFHVK